MRSPAVTLILALLAVLVCGLAGWQWREGSFDSVLGAPPVAVGQRIYAFAPAEVKFIRVAQPGLAESFEYGPGGWRCVAPWQDRMDPRAAADIVNFTLALRVEDAAPTGEMDLREAGLKDGGINIRLEGADHAPLAKYKLGRRTPWLAGVPDREQPVPTVFVMPRDPDHGDFVYAGTGDISAWFRDSFRYLRDHRPLYFHPAALQRIRLRAGQDELTLACAAPGQPWRIVRPQELRTDVAAMRRLIEGLVKLEAVKVMSRDSVTLPGGGTATGSVQIALAMFGSEDETILDIFPPETSAATETFATVSNRPDTVFSLPLKPEANAVTLADLPLKINDLRDPTLAKLDLAKLRGVRIQPANGPEIAISRPRASTWLASIDGQTEEANRERLTALLDTVMTGRATGFETDAASDFSPWGLDKPFLKLEFTGESDGREVKISLAFGADGKGRYFANRLGTPTVMSVDPLLVAALPVKAYEWRASRLWSIDRSNLESISRGTGAGPPLTLTYRFDTDEWKAIQGTADLTANLAQARANYLLGVLEGLRVTRWLSPDDEAAERALLRPSLVFLVIEKKLDAEGEEIGRLTRTLFLAPAGTAASAGFYYGRLAGDAQPFLLDRETYSNLATAVVETE